MVGRVGARSMTVDEFVTSKFFEDGLWELCEGELVMMSPARPLHEAVVMNIGYLFRNVVKEKGGRKCGVFGSNVGLRFDEGRSFVMPDLSVCCDRSVFEEEWFLGAPELVVEVLSKGTWEYDLGRKREVYRGFGVKECWIVDCEEGWIEVENFELGLKRKCGRGEVVKSWEFGEFEFGVDEVFDV
jgi:Uma2 family endonuclease